MKNPDPEADLPRVSAEAMVRKAPPLAERAPYPGEAQRGTAGFGESRFRLGDDTGRIGYLLQAAP